jgi:hypothetical protein
MPSHHLSKHIVALSDHSTKEFYTRPSLLPFMYISKQATLDFGDNGTFTIVIYGAYNAMGLIGTEKNGIAILDETRKQVLLDEHQPTNSGYFTPTDRQQRGFDELVGANWEVFQSFVNHHDRARYTV